MSAERAVNAIRQMRITLCSPLVVEPSPYGGFDLDFEGEDLEVSIYAGRDGFSWTGAVRGEPLQGVTRETWLPAGLLQVISQPAP